MLRFRTTTQRESSKSPDPNEERMSTTQQTKKQLRRALRQRRATIDHHATRSVAICARVIAHPIYQQACAIHCYLPVHTEVDTRPLLHDALARGKQIIVPVVTGNELIHTTLTSLATEDLIPDSLGIPQPRTLCHVEAGIWDVCIVPLLAFDRAGYRLGYGKGFYDRLLAPLSLPTIGLAFALQEIDTVPHAPHDIPLDWIVTEHETIETGRQTSDGRPATTEQQ
jgi:5-formyltetrahydrofolate cyclo-ligase